MTTPSFIPSLPNNKIFSNKKIYRFQYETSNHIKIKPFYGYLNPSFAYSIMSLKRLHEHSLDESTCKPVTSFTYTRDNKFGNIVGMYELEIFLGGRNAGIGSVGVGYDVGGSETGTPAPYMLHSNNEKKEKKINVLMLKESDVDFRLGADFISAHNIVIEPKGRSSNNKGNFTHQFKFEDGLTVDLEEIEDEHYDDDNSDEEDHKHDKKKTGDKIVQNSTYNESYKKFKDFLMSRSGLFSIIIFLTFLIVILYNSYATSQSLLEEFVILPYNKRLTRPGIENKLEDYARKLKIATSFLELFELDKPQPPKRSTSPKREGEGKGEGEGEREGGGGGGGGDTGSQELYTNLIQFTESIDNTKRTLLNTYNQEESFFWLFQQNIENLLKYLKKKSIIFRTISIPLKNFDLLINDIETVIINNIDLVTKEVITTNSYCDEIMFQVKKMISELDVFIIDSSKPFSSWLNALIRFGKKGGNIDNLGEIDYATALKVKKLLLALNNDLFEISIFFTDLKSYLNNYSRDLLVLFLEYFRSRITDLEINIIKNHLVKLRTNRDHIFDEILVNYNNSGDNEPLVGCRIRQNDLVVECSG